MSLKEKFKKFNVEMIMDHGGCKPAMKYFREKYGDEVDNLAQRKKDVVEIIESGKADWVLNFCLNCMTDEERKRYLESILLNIGCIFWGDVEVNRAVELIVGKCIHNIDHEDIPSLISSYKANISRLEKIEDLSISEFHQFKIMVTIVRTHELWPNNPVKAARMATINSSEAIASYTHYAGHPESIKDFRYNIIKKNTYYAMKLVGLWD